MSEVNEQAQTPISADDNKFYGMRYDIVFKKAFVENNDLLKRFISDMLDIPFDDIGEVTVSNPELLPDGTDEKFSRLDIKAYIRNAIVNIEMTISRMTDYEKRAVYYWSGMYHGQPIKGYSYSSLKKTIYLNVLAYRAYAHEDYHSMYVIYDKKHDNTINDVLELHFFELPKIMPNPETEEEIRQNMWLETISANSEEEMKSVCDKYNNDYVSKCAKVVTDMNADEKFREILRAREEAEIERGAMLYDARQEGKEEGKAEGLAEGLLKGKAEALVNLMKNLKYSLMDSMNVLNIPTSDYAAYTEIIRKNYPDVTI